MAKKGVAHALHNELLGTRNVERATLLVRENNTTAQAAYAQCHVEEVIGGLVPGCHTALTALARHRVIIDRHRHRARKTKARLSFPTTGPRLPTRTTPATISISGPLTA